MRPRKTRSHSTRLGFESLGGSHLSKTLAGRGCSLEPLEERALLTAFSTPNVPVNDITDGLVNSANYVKGATWQSSSSTLAFTDGSGEHVVTAFDSPGPTNQSPYPVAGWSTSDDGGSSFSEQSLVNPEPEGVQFHANQGDGLPQLARDASGNIYMVTTSYYGIFLTNEDGSVVPGKLSVYKATSAAPDGFGWLADALTSVQQFYPASDTQHLRDKGFLDNPTIAVDTFPNVGSEDLAGTIYVAATVSNGANGAGSSIAFAKLTPEELRNGTNTFSAAQQFGYRTNIADGFDDTTMIADAWVTVGTDHSVYLTWIDANDPHLAPSNPAYDPNAQHLVMLKSTDGGVSFHNPHDGSSAPMQIADLHLSQNFLSLVGTVTSFDSAINGFSQIAVNPANGALYLVYTDDPDGTGGAPERVLFKQSLDGGATWTSTPIVVNNNTGPSDSYQPNIAITPDGSELFVGFYDNRRDSALVDAWGAIADIATAGPSAGTATFHGDNFRVSDRSSPSSVVYTGHPEETVAVWSHGNRDVISAGDHTFYDTWTDGRNSALLGGDFINPTGQDFNSDVYLQRVPDTAAATTHQANENDPTDPVFVRGSMIDKDFFVLKNIPGGSTVGLYRANNATSGLTLVKTFNEHQLNSLTIWGDDKATTTLVVDYSNGDPMSVFLGGASGSLNLDGQDAGADLILRGNVPTDGVEKYAMTGVDSGTFQIDSGAKVNFANTVWVSDEMSQAPIIWTGRQDKQELVEVYAPRTFADISAGYSAVISAYDQTQRNVVEGTHVKVMAKTSVELDGPDSSHTDKPDQFEVLYTGEPVSLTSHGAADQILLGYTQWPSEQGHGGNLNDFAHTVTVNGGGNDILTLSDSLSTGNTYTIESDAVTTTFAITQPVAYNGLGQLSLIGGVGSLVDVEHTPAPTTIDVHGQSNNINIGGSTHTLADRLAGPLTIAGHPDLTGVTDAALNIDAASDSAPQVITSASFQAAGTPLISFTGMTELNVHAGDNAKVNVQSDSPYPSPMYTTIHGTSETDVRVSSTAFGPGNLDAIGQQWLTIDTARSLVFDDSGATVPHTYELDPFDPPNETAGVFTRTSDPGDLVDTIVTYFNLAQKPVYLGSQPEVVGRYLFYNDSFFDDPTNDPSFTNDTAIAIDKQALLPGAGLADFSNISTYDKGINGIMIDLKPGIGNHSAITASDFDFKTSGLGSGGVSNDPSTWTALTTPPAVTLRLGQGPGGSDRIELIWPAGTILDTWLQVVVKSDENTGLENDDVFYFGSMPGETGNDTDPMFHYTDVLDQALIRASSNLANSDLYYVQMLVLALENIYDVNRDDNVDVLDQAVARTYSQFPKNELDMISMPPLA